MYSASRNISYSQQYNTCIHKKTLCKNAIMQQCRRENDIMALHNNFDNKNI